MVLERIGMDSWALVARTEKRKFFAGESSGGFRIIFKADGI